MKKKTSIMTTSTFGRQPKVRKLIGSQNAAAATQPMTKRIMILIKTKEDNTSKTPNQLAQLTKTTGVKRSVIMTRHSNCMIWYQAMFDLS